MGKHYRFANGDHSRVRLVLHDGGTVAMESDGGGGGACSRYTVTVAPGATCMRDLDCDCPLQQKTMFDIGCVHIAEVVAAWVRLHKLPDETATYHDFLVGEKWHIGSATTSPRPVKSLPRNRHLKKKLSLRIERPCT